MELLRPRRFSSVDDPNRRSDAGWPQGPKSIRPSSLSPCRDVYRASPRNGATRYSSVGRRTSQNQSLVTRTKSRNIHDGGVIIEELLDGQELDYDADIEIRQPDEYDEAESDNETPISLLGTLPLNEANLAEHFRRLNCDGAESNPAGITEGGGFGKQSGISRKRNRIESIPSISDGETGSFLDSRPKRRRQTRRAETPAHDSSSMHADTSPLEYSPLTTRSPEADSPSSENHRKQPTRDAVMDIDDCMDTNAG